MKTHEESPSLLPDYGGRWSLLVEEGEEEQDEEKQGEEKQENVEDIMNDVLKSFICDKCGKSYRTKKLLYYHNLRTHSAPVPCDICHKFFASKRHLNIHKRTVHAPPSYTCNLCGKGFKSLKNLKYHETLCGSFRRNKGHIPCEICHKKYSDEKHLEAHVKKAHTVTSSVGTFVMNADVEQGVGKKESQEIDCVVCRKTFRKRIYLNAHMKKVHEAEQEDEHLFLIKKIKKKRVIIENMRVNTSKHANPLYLCSKCPRKFPTTKRLRLHMEEEHQGQKPFKCNFCPSSFETDRLVKMHIGRVHVQKRFSCQYCEKKFKLNQSLKQHVYRHENPLSPRKLKNNFQIMHSELRKRRNETVDNFAQKLKDFPEKDQKWMIKHLIRSNPNFLDRIENNPLSENDAIEMIVDNSLPDNVILNILKKLRKKWGMNICVKNIRKHLIERKQIFKPHFEVKLLNEDTETMFKDKMNNVLPRQVVYCKDVEAVQTILKEQIKDFSSEEYLCVLAADGGKNNLKICLNFSKKTKDKNKWKLFGPKHSLVLATVCDVPETYNNIKVLFDLIDIKRLNFKLSTDLKLVNIVCGKQTNSSKYPCCYGDCCQDKDGNWIKGQKLTKFSDFRDNFQNYVETGNGNRKKLMKYKNCEFDPLLDLDECILHAIPPQVLHGVLLATNKIVEDIDKVKNQFIKSLGEGCPEDIKHFCIFSEISRLYIVREGYQGKTFEGKQCRTILKLIEKINFPEQFEPFVMTLKAHRDLVKLCYREDLPSNYSEVISKLRSSYYALKNKFNVTISNKFHIIFDHLTDYFDHTNLSLVKTSDELIENMHQYVHKRMLRSGYKVKDIHNPLHGINLLRAVLHINAYNIVFDNEEQEIDENIDPT